jgi:hypothetical protein
MSILDLLPDEIPPPPSMRRLGLLLALTLLGTHSHAQQVGPPNLIVCNQTAQASPVAAGTVSLVDGVANQRIYICGWHATSTQSTSTTFQFIAGTQGGPCGTPTNLTPAFSVTSTEPSSDRTDYAQIQTPIDQQVCVVSTGATVGQAVSIYYAQF